MSDNVMLVLDSVTDKVTGNELQNSKYRNRTGKMISYRIQAVDNRNTPVCIIK